MSDWSWTDHHLYTEGRCGFASVNFDHRDDCWRVFARTAGVYVKPEVAARLPVRWTEE